MIHTAKVVNLVDYCKEIFNSVTEAVIYEKRPSAVLGLFLCTQSRGRTGTGVNLLVFETSASTDSAIWASCLFLRVQRYNVFLNPASDKHIFLQ